MAAARWLEFRGSKLVAVRGSPDRVCVELEGCIRQWEGAGASRRGTSWLQRVQIEIAFPDVDQGIAELPAELWGGTVTSDGALNGSDGGLSLPTTVKAMIVLELAATSGEILRIAGERMSADTSGEPRSLEELPANMDPERDTN